jgi:ACS family sodium-dependent inorganic phosphate cotransporter
MTTAATPAPSSRWPAYYTVVGLCFAAVFISYIDRTNISVAAIAMKEQFGWTETVKGLVLSSFYVGYLALMLVSGVLANRYGGRIVLCAAVVWWSLFTALTPPAALMSFSTLVAARIALGMGEAAVFPASINMIGRWVSPERRSRAVALVASGLMIGTVVALPVTGWLVRDFGWPVPFYAFGAVGIVWAVVWLAKVENGRGVPEPAGSGPKAIPWGRIVRTPAVWAIVATHFAHNWGLYLMLSWLPSYFKATFNVSLASAGLLSAAPWLVNFAMANVAGHVADRLIRNGWSTTRVRKLMQAIGLPGGALFLLLLQLAGTPVAAVAIMCGATSMLAFCIAGFGPNSLDISPRYGDVIWSLSNTFATLPGVIGVYITGWLVDRTGSYHGPFLLTAGIYLAAALVYSVFGSGEPKID